MADQESQDTGSHHFLAEWRLLRRNANREERVSSTLAGRPLPRNSLPRSDAAEDVSSEETLRPPGDNRESAAIVRIDCDRTRRIIGTLMEFQAHMAAKNDHLPGFFG